MSRNGPFSLYEFFAGGGMARLGLGEHWGCLFANDFDAGKAAVYRDNFGDAHMRQGDVWDLTAGDLPGRADLAWASSPCQDFSLAGARAGLAGGKSSAFYGFWRLIEALDDEGRAPRALVIENVSGLLTSHGGADFAALAQALSGRGYRFGALEIDAAAFLPQSRPRVFIIATREAVPANLIGPSPFHSKAVRAAFTRLSIEERSHWLWWRLVAPPLRNQTLAALLEPDAAVKWRTPEQTGALLGLMTPLHYARLKTAAAAADQGQGGRAVGAVFRRMRGGDQRAEARFDGLAGCLRTPAGGSSRQTLVIAEGDSIRSRLLTGREGARLMGLPDSYRLPASQTAALQVVGDGVAVPVVRWLAEHLLEPLLGGPRAVRSAA
jgi:DNA (cytosine-5)-methyltransferase 1